MSINDPVGDMLTRIRNAQMRGRTKVITPGSRLRRMVLDVLRDEGYIVGYGEAVNADPRDIEIELKYHQGKSVIAKIRRVSKPGRRVYSGTDDIPLVLNGLGICVLSTSRGVMSDHAARAARLGGEVLCEVS